MIKNWLNNELLKNLDGKIFYYYYENCIDWVDIEMITLFCTIVNYLENFKKVKSTIERIPLKRVLKAMLKIIKEEDEKKKFIFLMIN